MYTRYKVTIAKRKALTATYEHATTEGLLEAVFSFVRAPNVATQRRSKHASARIEELCFLRGPCRGIIYEGRI
jgi:hypothetical protein